MKKFLIITALVAAGSLASGDAQARDTQTLAGRIARHRAQFMPWHGGYYHTSWGTPVALVVPPTAGVQTNWSWGVGGTRLHPIRHQFARPYPGQSYQAGPGFAPTPYWPTDTDQFGAYYIRGPW